ncbi:MAG: hypothetical protein ACP59X_17345 [Solidesulfovibrio sp. DCME]|uniref:hypothetical protein n=1 Tax=Solidesulfovibrio sp. DCME TaxID=3447380 RepID=UPI003D0AFC8F
MEAKRMRLLGLCVLVLMLSAGCTKVNKVTPIQQLEKGKVGLIYALPKTELVVEVPITVTIKNGALQKASYSIANDKLHAIEYDCVKFFKKTAYPITTELRVGEMKLSLQAAPDGDNVFSIDPNSSLLKDSKKNLNFNEQHMLVSGSFSSKNNTLQFVVKSITALAKIIPAAFGLPVGAEAVSPLAALTTLEAAPVRQPKEEMAAEKEKLRNVACQALFNKMMQQIDDAQKRYNEATLKREDFVFGRNVGGVDRNLDVYKARVAEGDKVIKELKSSTNLNETVVLTFKKIFTAEELGDISPNAVKSIVLFELRDDKLYTKYQDAFADKEASKFLDKVEERDVKNPRRVVLMLQQLPNDPALAVKEALTDPPKGVQGLYYRMPALVHAWFDNAGVKTQPQTISVAQWGPILALPSRMGSSDAAVTFEFFADTGALKSIGTETKSLDMSQVEAVGTAGSALIQAVYSSTDPNNELRREKERLSLEKDIKDLRSAIQPTSQ